MFTDQMKMEVVPNMRCEDLMGRVFGMLTVKRFAEKRGIHYYWECVCSCGKETLVDGYNLRSGKTRSCGCLRATVTAEVHTTHGDARLGKVTRLRRLWNGMKNRCYNANEPGYKWYGAKGVIVCEDWHDYAKFKSWALANGYTDELSIDRIDPNGDYEPSNCRWITRSENSARSQSLDEDIEMKARALAKGGASVREISRQTGVSIGTAYAVRKRAGVSTDMRARKIAAMKEIVRGLWNVGAKPSIIHKAMGYDYATIRKYINEFTREAESAAS